MRRNRATQSCLRCHTSKRKCDRKRPCQRCIQLGMTGLCSYEVEDPDARHDPNVAETTRLQNRIAELEIVVRELRGKPHPRQSGRHSQRDSAPLLFPMKIEPTFTVEQLEYQHQMPPSPSPMFGGFEQHSVLPQGYATFESQSSVSPTSPCSEYVTFVAGELLFATVHVFGARLHALPQHGPSCVCLFNPSTRDSLEFLASQIQGTLNRLEKLPEHIRDSQCPIYQIIEVNSILW